MITGMTLIYKIEKQPVVVLLQLVAFYMDLNRLKKQTGFLCSVYFTSASLLSIYITRFF